MRGVLYEADESGTLSCMRVFPRCPRDTLLDRMSQPQLDDLDTVIVQKPYSASMPGTRCQQASSHHAHAFSCLFSRAGSCFPP